MFDQINNDIVRFINSDGNEALSLATGPESVPFRGSFLGAQNKPEALARIKSKQTCALWLGSNPNVSSGLGSLRTGSSARNGVDAFRQQSESDSVGHLLDCSSNPIKNQWDPIQRPAGPWKVYSDVLRETLGADSTVFMNYFPWGSSNLKEFRIEQPELFERAVRFSDKTFKKVMSELKPNVLLIPFSLEREVRKGAGDAEVLVSILSETRDEHFILNNGRRFRWFSSVTSINQEAVLVLLVPHPSSIRLTKEGRIAVHKGLCSRIQGFLKDNSSDR